MRSRFHIITTFRFVMLKIVYFVRKTLASRVNNLIILGIRNAKFTKYRFLNEPEHIEIFKCIIVLLKEGKEKGQICNHKSIRFFPEMLFFVNSF